MELRQVASAIVVTTGLFAACTQIKDSSPPGVDLQDGGSGGDTSGQPGSAAGDGGDGHAGEPSSDGGAPAGVELSIWPTYAADPQQASDAQAVFAAVSVLSAGATTLTLAERWDELSGATGSPRTLAWNRIEAMAKPYRDKDGNVAFCIDVVDRQQSAWPFKNSLAEAAAREAMHRTIDELYARFAAQLTHLCFGYEVDRYLSVASSSDAGNLLDFLEDSVAYARQHVAHTERIAVGVAVTLGALSDPKNADAPWLLGDEAIAVYDALARGNDGLKSPASGAEELGDALDALANGSGLPLALWEVGYPSSAGSNQKAQREYFNDLFALVGERRDHISFVSVFSLNDRLVSDCDAEAARFGDEPGSLRSEARCAMGLRADGANKLAWPTVLSALARYR
ncbi:MAG TPA: hypothetical protein VHB79_32265 [Polyangiaceae bacterium]|nr:hypothetical protein [Polyangiaceae bacterium]